MTRVEGSGRPAKVGKKAQKKVARRSNISQLNVSKILKNTKCFKRTFIKTVQKKKAKVEIC